mgnify:CR=1 FL=1|jgi:uncharacterized protein (TIGR02466 family)
MNIQDIINTVEQSQSITDNNEIPPKESQIPPHLVGVKMPDILPLFPKVVTAYNFDAADQYELKQFVKDYMSRNKGVECSNGYNLTNWCNTSKENFLDIDEPIVQKFSKFINDSYETLVKVIHWDLSSDHIIPQCWISKTEKDGFQSRHSHANSWVSGTYYLDFPENSSPIRMWDSVSDMSAPFLQVNAVEHNPFNAFYQDLMPREGTLFLWQSNLLHETLPNNSDSRISISFNILPKEIDNGVYSIKTTR